MVKKIIIALIIIISLAGIITTYFFLKETATPVSPAINAVPLNSALVFESKDLNGLLKNLDKTNKIWSELLDIKTINKLNHNFRFLDSLFAKNAKAGKLIQNKSLIIATCLTGNENFDLLYLFNLSSYSEQEQIDDLIKEQLKGKASFSERHYEKITINDVKMNSQSEIKSFSYAFSKGILIYSPTSILIENAIRQLNSTISLKNDFGFKKVLNTAGKKVTANIYINYKTFPKLISLFLETDSKRIIRSFTNFADWSELDLNFKNDAMLLNGFTYSNDSNNNYLNIFLKQSPQKVKLTSILPATTSTFIVLGVDDFKQFSIDYKKFLNLSGKLNVYSNEIEKINTDYNTNIEELFYSLLEKEIGIAYANFNELDLSKDQYLILSTHSQSQSEEKMLELLESYAKNKKISVNTLIKNCKIDEETSYKVYKFPVNNIASTLFGKLFSSIESNYFTFIDNYIIFGSTVEMLSKFIHCNVLQQTLTSDLQYNKISDYLSSRSNFYFYTNMTSSPLMLSEYLNEDLAKSLKTNIKSLKKFHALGIQFSLSDAMIYNNIFLKYTPEIKAAPRTVWESKLDTCIGNFKPKFVINHTNDEKEIFVQDLKNNCYLINSAGRILWKTNVKEKIISDVYQVDFMKNKKLQYLFNTRNHIYLIDRNGNHVDRYPVKLQSPASNGMAVFDYENNREYRIMLASENRKIFVYDITGNIIKGWMFDKTETLVKRPAQHFRVSDKDYIVFADSLKIYMLDRKGNTRVKLKTIAPKSVNNSFVFEDKPGSLSPRLVTTSTEGDILFIYFDGKSETMKLEDLEPDHYFDFMDVDGDGLKDFIFINENKLQVYSHGKTKIFEYEFKAKITSLPTYYLFPKNERKIGVTSTTTNELFLFNSNGTIYEGFPLTGKSIYSIGHLNKSESKFNLIVGSADVFLYNYEVQ